MSEGQGSLVSCSPWGHKESDMAERLNNNNFKLKSVLLCVKSFSCVWLFVSPWTVAHQSPSVHGISQAKILEKFAMSSSRGSSQPRDQTLVSCVSCIARRFFTTVPLGRPRCSFQIRQIRSVAQPCPTLHDPMNRSTSGLPIHHQLPEFT